MNQTRTPQSELRTGEFLPLVSAIMTRNGQNETKANSFRSTGFPFSCKFCIINVVNWTYTIGDRREKAKKKNLGHKGKKFIHLIVHSQCVTRWMNSLNSGPGIFRCEGKVNASDWQGCWLVLPPRDKINYSRKAPTGPFRLLSPFWGLCVGR